MLPMQHPTMGVQPEKAALRHAEAEGERASRPGGAVLKREAFVTMAPVPELGSYSQNEWSSPPWTRVHTDQRGAISHRKWSL